LTTTVVAGQTADDPLSLPCQLPTIFVLEPLGVC
jgi:hypothetical protein